MRPAHDTTTGAASLPLHTKQKGADEGPKLKERAFIPDAWDDSDSESDGEGTSEGLTTETESATIKGSTNSLAGMADGAWGESEGEGEE